MDASRDDVSEQEELLSSWAHDLRNPLNAILGWATVLRRRSDLPEGVMQGLQAIERNSRLQARMISDLLDYAAISAGKCQLLIETLDPYAVVRSALEAAAAAGQGADVAVESTFDEEPLHIEADCARLQQIIGNLLSSALQFCGRGDTVRLTAGRRGDCFRLAMSGWGASTHREGGLGMAIVERLTGLHAGTVRTERGIGDSPGFVLELPLRAAASRNKSNSDAALQNAP